MAFFVAYEACVYFRVLCVHGRSNSMMPQFARIVVEAAMYSVFGHAVSSIVAPKHWRVFAFVYDSCVGAQQYILRCTNGSGCRRDVVLGLIMASFFLHDQFYSAASFLMLLHNITCDRSHLPTLFDNSSDGVAKVVQNRGVIDTSIFETSHTKIINQFRGWGWYFADQKMCMWHAHVTFTPCALQNHKNYLKLIIGENVEIVNNFTLLCINSDHLSNGSDDDWTHVQEDIVKTGIVDIQVTANGGQPLLRPSRSMFILFN